MISRKLFKAAFATLLCLPGLSLATESQVQLDGRYYWELLFSYDNSQNSGDIVEQFNYSKETTVDTENFRQSTIYRNEVWEQNGQFNVGITWNIIDISPDVSYSYHLQASQELVETFRENVSTITSETRQQTYTIGAGSKLDVYRLVYTTTGMTIKTDVFSTSPLPQSNVTIQYNVDETILGFNELAWTLINTYPGRDNKEEWDRVRDALVQNAHRDEIAQFSALVETLRTIYPRGSNQWEWEAIRATSNEIVADWDAYSKQKLLNKLLTRLSSIYPGRDNRSEWEAIRYTTSNILNTLSVTY